MSASAAPLPGLDAAIVRRAFLIDLTLITVVWALGSVIANPVGEFPLNDDWSYSRAAEVLVETGDYRPLGWAVMSLFTHVLWGAIFCLPAGCSFTALRISSVIAGLLGLYGTYVLVRDQQQPRWLALIVTLVLAFYPSYFLLSHTFMTDVPFVAATIWSAVFLARALRIGSGAHLLAGTALAGAATLSRQVGLALPLAFAAIVVLRPRLDLRKVLYAIAPLIACVVLLLVYNHWLEVTGRAPVQYTALSNSPLKHSTNLVRAVFTLAFFSYYSPIYLGLFLLPFFLASPRHLFWSDSMKSLWRSHGKRAMPLVIIGLGAMAASAALFSRYNGPLLLPMEDRGNMLGKWGLGPLSLRDSIILRLDHHLAPLPTWFWVAITALGVAGGVLLMVKLSIHGADFMARLVRRRQDVSDNEAVSMFLVICGFIYLLPFLSYGFYDRYLMLLLPFFAAAVAGASGPFGAWRYTRPWAPTIIGLGMLAIWAAITISGTRDYLTWNRMRWQALNDLMLNDHVAADKIDGGFEFNGLHFYDPNYKVDPAKSSWWVQQDTYQIGFGVVPGYRVVREYTYQHWFPPHTQKIVVMRKEEDSS